MTFSLAARCPESGMCGAVCASSSVCVAARCLFAGAGGAALSQNVTDPTLGPKLLAAAASMGAKAAMEKISAAAPFAEWRQLALADRNGETAFFNGAKTLGIHSGAVGENCVAVGNLLSASEVPEAMVSAYAKCAGDFPDRLLAALDAGENAGGETGEIRSAGMIARADGAEWAAVDLRADWSSNPLAELRKMWEVYRPQMADYILRANDPDSAPPFA